MSKSFEQILSEAVEATHARRQERREAMIAVANKYGYYGAKAEHLVNEMEAAVAGR